jgi:hypothetical protein
MKILYIFRGEIERYRDIYTNALIAYEKNWKKTLYNLDPSKYTCDTAFVTYNHHLLEQLIQLMQPKYVVINERTTQNMNMKHACDLMKEKQNEYDRFLIIRFDIAYRMPIDSFPKWEKTGIFLLNRDVHFPTTKYYTDVFFIVDKKWVDTFSKQHLLHNNGDPYYVDLPHMITRNLFIKNIPFHCILGDKYYHNSKHPIIMYLIHYPIEEIDPDNSPEIPSLPNVRGWNHTLTDEQFITEHNRTEPPFEDNQ